MALRTAAEHGRHTRMAENLPELTYTFRASTPVPKLPPYPALRAEWPDRAPIEEWAFDPKGLAEVRRRRGHARRIRQAEFMNLIQADPDRCRFGPRRMTLVGTTRAQTTQEAVGNVVTAVRWSLRRIYGEDSDIYYAPARRGLPHLSLTITPPPLP